MTKGELIGLSGVDSDYYSLEDLLMWAYNLALEHAAEKALTISDGSHDIVVDKESILNLKITE